MSDKPLSGELFTPSEDVLRRATVRNWDELAAKAGHDLEGFWAAEANELHWFTHWERVLDDRQKPFYKWFVGGKTNIVYNCLDRHARDGTAQQTRADVGRRERGVPLFFVLRVAARDLPLRERAAEPWCSER